MKYTASIRYQKDGLKYIKVNNPENPKNLLNRSYRMLLKDWQQKENKQKECGLRTIVASKNLNSKGIRISFIF